MPAITIMVSPFDLDIDSSKPTSVCILKRSEMEEDSFSCGLEFCFFIQPPVVNFPGTANNLIVPKMVFVNSPLSGICPFD